MALLVRTVGAHRVLCYPNAGSLLATTDDALDVVAVALEERVSTVVVPVERLDPRFFQLGTGVAGAFLQKLCNYGLRLVVAGDISQALGASGPLRDFVRESNRGGQVWFVASITDLEDRLASR